MNHMEERSEEEEVDSPRLPTCAMRMPTTMPSWWNVPRAPRRAVGETSPTYMGTKPVVRPE